MKSAIFKGLATPASFLVKAGTGFAALAIFLTTSLPADAAIRCKGQFQIIKGQGAHATPYCEDNYLAGIARGYGWKVSNAAIRNNPTLKSRVCRHIGHDNRLIQICSGRGEGNSRRGFFN